jgi:hypothetical protein
VALSQQLHPATIHHVTKPKSDLDKRGIAGTQSQGPQMYLIETNLVP